MDRRRMLLVIAAVLAVLGVGLVFVFARGADSRAAEEFETVKVLAVAPGQTIVTGEDFDSALDAEKLTQTDIAVGQVLDGAITNADLDDLAGQVALTTLYSGEQIIRKKFGGVGDSVDDSTLPLPEGTIAKPETFDAAVGSFIRPGAQLAVFLTADASTSTCLLLDEVNVIAVGGSTSAESTDGSAALHLAVTQEEFEWIEDAKRRGELSVALLNDSSEVTAATTGACGQIRGES